MPKSEHSPGVLRAAEWATETGKVVSAALEGVPEPIGTAVLADIVATRLVSVAGQNEAMAEDLLKLFAETVRLLMDVERAKALEAAHGRH